MKRILLLAFLVIGMMANAQLRWETTVEGGYEIGTSSSDFEANRFAGNVVMGVKASDFLTVGIGAGVRVYDDNSSENNILTPVFVRFKADITKDRRVTPFVQTDLGATMFPEYGWEYIGFLSSFGGGVDVKVADKTFVSFGLNYASQHYSNSKRANAVGFTTGLTF